MKVELLCRGFRFQASCGNAEETDVVVNALVDQGFLASVHPLHRTKVWFDHPLFDKANPPDHLLHESSVVFEQRVWGNEDRDILEQLVHGALKNLVERWLLKCGWMVNLDCKQVNRFFHLGKHDLEKYQIIDLPSCVCNIAIEHVSFQNNKTVIVDVEFEIADVKVHRLTRVNFHSDDNDIVGRNVQILNHGDWIVQVKSVFTPDEAYFQKQTKSEQVATERFQYNVTKDLLRPCSPMELQRLYFEKFGWTFSTKLALVQDVLDEFNTTIVPVQSLFSNLREVTNAVEVPSTKAMCERIGFDLVQHDLFEKVCHFEVNGVTYSNAFSCQREKIQNFKKSTLNENLKRVPWMILPIKRKAVANLSSHQLKTAKTPNLSSKQLKMKKAVSPKTATKKAAPNFSKWKVKELKAFLKAHNLKVGGKREELIERASQSYSS